MSLFLRFEELPPLTFTGFHRRTNLLQEPMTVSWRELRLRKPEITGCTDDCFYSVQVYDSPDYFRRFQPERMFDQWAAVRVTEGVAVPEGMQQLHSPGGLYAVFQHRGTPAQFAQTAQFIFGSWLPQSGYTLDQRPHFEQMAPGYRHDDPGAEEEVWVPVVKQEVP